MNSSKKGRRVTEAISYGLLRDFTSRDKQIYNGVVTDIICDDGTKQTPLVYSSVVDDFDKYVILGGVEGDGSCTLSLVMTHLRTGRALEYGIEFRNRNEADLANAIKVANKLISKIKSVKDPVAFSKVARAAGADEYQNDLA